MPKPKAVVSLSALIDSDIEEVQNSDADVHPTPDSNQENSNQTKKDRGVRGKPKVVATRNTRSKAASMRSSGDSGIVKRKAVPRKKAVVKRTALKEQTNEQHYENAKESGIKKDQREDPLDDEGMAVSMDELDTKEVTEQQPTQRGRRVKKQVESQPEREPQEHAAATENDEVFEYTPTVTRQSKLSKKAPPTQRIAAGKLNSLRETQQDQKTIPDTQDAQLDLDASGIPDADDYVEDAIPQSAFRQSSNKRSSSRQPPPLLSRKRAGSASDNDRGSSDPVTRRKLGEMTRRYEDLDAKFRNLREIGIKEAEANFDKLKLQSESKSKGNVYSCPT